MYNFVHLTALTKLGHTLPPTCPNGVNIHAIKVLSAGSSCLGLLRRLKQTTIMAMRKCSFISARSTRLSSLYETELSLSMRLRLRLSDMLTCVTM